MLTSLPFPFPYTSSPSFLSSALLNHTHILGKRIVSMHDLEEEEFIDIEVRPSDSRDLEFQMCSSFHKKEAKPFSPADELFYKGKLLHNSISPSFHVTQNLAFEEEEGKEEEEYMLQLQWSAEVSDRLSKNQTTLTQKLKSSTAYLRSFFTTSACSDEAKVSKNKVNNVSKHTKLVKRNSFEQAENERHRHQVSAFTMKSILEREVDHRISYTCHRKSFSGAIKRHCTSSKSHSSSSSNSSSFSIESINGFYEINLLKSSINANSEVENSVEAAIAHCKKSQLKHDT